MEDIEIVREFKAKIQKDINPHSQIYFYGSRANRTHRDDSDLDVLVLLDDNSPSVRKKVTNIAWEIGFKYSILIVPVISSYEEFQKSSASPYYNNVKRSGITV